MTTSHTWNTVVPNPRENGPKPEAWLDQFGPKPETPPKPSPRSVSLVDLQAETALLGACLLNREAIDAAADLSPDDFEDSANAATFEAIMALYAQGQPVDLISVAGKVKGVSTGYIGGLTDATPTSHNAPYYAQAVRTAAHRRRMLLALKSATKAIENGGDLPDLTALVEDMERATPAGIVFADVANAGEPEPALFTAGPRRGNLGLVVAESGRGKSYLLLALASSTATGKALVPSFAPLSSGGKVLYVGYEDPPEVMRQRLEAIDVSGDVLEAERGGLLRFVASPEALFTQTRDGVIPTDYYRRLVKVIKTERPDIVIVDPLSGAASITEENSNGALGTIAATLARLGEDNHCAVILCHHASKGRAEVATQHMARGGSALACRARWIVTLTAPTDIEGSNLILASVVKDSYGPTPPPILLRRGKGGALVEESYQEKREQSLAVLAEGLAMQLGKNEAQWAKSRLFYGPECKDFRAAIKTKYGTTATVTNLKLAYDIALRDGLIKEGIRITGGTEGKVPFAVSHENGINEGGG